MRRKGRADIHQPLFFEQFFQFGVLAHSQINRLLVTFARQFDRGRVLSDINHRQIEVGLPGAGVGQFPMMAVIGS